MLPIFTTFKEMSMPKLDKKFSSGSGMKLNEVDAFALAHFDSLPDSAMVKAPVVSMIFGRSISQIYRDTKEDLFPAPCRTGRNSVAWQVGTLRAILKNMSGSDA